MTGWIEEMDETRWKHMLAWTERQETMGIKWGRQCPVCWTIWDKRLSWCTRCVDVMLYSVCNYGLGYEPAELRH